MTQNDAKMIGLPDTRVCDKTRPTHNIDLHLQQCFFSKMEDMIFDVDLFLLDSNTKFKAVSSFFNTIYN